MGEEGRGGARRPLTYEDRLMIEQGLYRGDRISTIAKALGRSQSTIEREVRRNFTDSPQGTSVVTTRNICAKRAECEVRRLCPGRCMAPCRKCRQWLCNSLCPDFEAQECPTHSKAPYVCNNCSRRTGMGCQHPYRFYEARHADEAARRRRAVARMGVDMTPQEFLAAIEAMREGLALGQSPAHVCATDERVGFSKSTFYRLLDGASAGDITKLDLPRAVRYRPRAKGGSASRSNIPRDLLEGRTYGDFCDLPEPVRDNAVEMDTVVGRQGRGTKCILTLYFRRLRFQLFLLMPDHTAASVAAALDSVQALCGPMFERVCGTILADRGSEFADAERIEHGRNGMRRCSLYYCDPLRSNQKGGCEKNHAELRRILPKGRTDFEALTERDMARCMSHVNSYSRASLDWFTPIDMARAVLPADLLDGLGIEKVDPQKVNLAPSLVPHAQVR